MKRFSIALALLAVVCLGGSAQGQGGHVDLNNLDEVTFQDYYDNDTFWYAGTPLVFELQFASGPDTIRGLTIGFEFGSETGSMFAPLEASEALSPGLLDSVFDLAHGVNPFGVDGVGYDTAGFYGSTMQGAGLAPGFSEVYALLQTNNLEEGHIYCLDSAFFPPSGIWTWAPGEDPTWGGPYCYEARYSSPFPELIWNCPGDDYIGSHCDLVTYDFDAFDPEQTEIAFELLSGPGTIDPASGQWSYQPDLSDVGTPIDLVIGAVEFSSGIRDTCICTLNFTNEAPVFAPMQTNYVAGAEDTMRTVLTGQTVDCDSAYTITLNDVIPDPQGTFELQDSTFSFIPAGGFYPDGDVEQEFEFQFQISDGIDATAGSIYVNVVDSTCCTLRGDIAFDGEGPNIEDLIYLVTYMFQDGPAPSCIGNCDVNGDGEGPDILDLTYTISYMFSEGPPPVPCP